MYIQAHTVSFAVICGEMFQRNTHSSVLDAKGYSCCNFTRNNRIFRKVFVVASAKRVSHNIESRSQLYIRAIFESLVSEGFPYLLRQLLIPCRSQRDTCRKSGSIECFIRILPGWHDSDSCRAVCHNYRRQAEFLQWIC